MLIIVGTRRARVGLAAATVLSQPSGSNAGMIAWRPPTHVIA